MEKSLAGYYYGLRSAAFLLPLEPHRRIFLGNSKIARRGSCSRRIKRQEVLTHTPPASMDPRILIRAMGRGKWRLLLQIKTCRQVTRLKFPALSRLMLSAPKMAMDSKIYISIF